ncbi:sugar transferase [Bifidobacterium stellenboschense]|uniref:Exopolysaccharide biosynthesis polyprenyl glycosylphosphotransferase n=1 Tax=Bifidobacterium stellenboschense TaxID=762211 RepID=A0A087DKT8_9BIFI|nr:sugar transferase [Bifidobacterium stellenboschense]KFI96138.1 exopolysaccharide biosynthesis polyprenyl glycosylphosphotransferase [Bifidobacterium stellenboschense]
MSQIASLAGRMAGDAVRQLNDMRQEQLSRVLYWRSFVNMALMLCDAAMFIIAGVTVFNLRREDGPFYSLRFDFFMDITVYLVLASLVWVCCLEMSGIYHRHVMGDGYQLNVKLFAGLCRCWVGLAAFTFFLDLHLTLVSMTLVVVSGAALTAVERVVARVFITRDRRNGAYAYATVVVGSPEGIARVMRFLGKREQLNYRPVAVCPVRIDPRTGLIAADDDLERLRELVPAVGRDVELVRYADSGLAEEFIHKQIQTVMVADVFRRFSDNFNTFSVRMESLGLEIALISSAADVAGHETQVRSIQDTTILTIRLSQYSPATRIVKRVFDLVISSLAIVCSLIVTLPVAIAIKLTDGGPVFYTQERIGLRGRPFRMIKFRSMVTNADALKAKLAEQTGQEDRFIFKMKDDPRITKVGRFIRRFSIDELPQFINVFRGDMSVVGPRPPLPEEFARYNQVYATRMLVKPGITGPWQVSGRSDLSAEESERLDVAYVQNWSIGGDIVLMFRTVGAVLGHKGAY